jgi:cytochrome c-type biogenesis protein
MALSVSILSAAAAGAISFLSPCVLPLVPPYLVYVSGVSLDSMNDAKAVDRGRVMAAALAFVAGFSTVFVLLGATASYAGQVLRDNITLLSSVAGVFIILMGLHFLGVFRIGLLNREVRYHREAKPAGLLGAYGVGLAFAFGWTPCIGPVLAAILSIAAQGESLFDGMILLAVYSLGLGLPFLLAAYSVTKFLAFFRSFKQHLGTVEKVMGGLLVVAGVLFLTGGLQRASFWLLETFPRLGSIG